MSNENAPCYEISWNENNPCLYFYRKDPEYIKEHPESVDRELLERIPTALQDPMNGKQKLQWETWRAKEGICIR